MRLNRTLRSAIRLADFCINHKVEPRVIAEMIAHAKAACTAYDRNDDNARDKHNAAVIRLAKTQNFTVEYDSVAPTLRRRGQYIVLPIFND